MTTPSWISLGSNLGDRKSILDAAIAALADAPGVDVRTVSSFHETHPVGGPPGQGSFLNAAAHLDTTLDPHQLLVTLQEVENQAGRVRTVRWGERTLDLDILIFGTSFLDTDQLKVPHPRLGLRRFVLAPLAEIAPDAEDRMTGLTVAELLANLDREPRFLAIDGLTGRRKSNVFRTLVEQLPAFGIAEADLRPRKGQEESVGDFLDHLEQKARAIRASSWKSEALRVPWIVADYYLGLDLLRTSSPSWLDGRFQADGIAQSPGFGHAIHQIRELARGTMTPTFVLLLPGETATPRRPGLLTIPQLRVESPRAHHISDEALATCQGITGV